MKELVRPRMMQRFFHVGEVYAIMIGKKKFDKGILKRIPKPLVEKYIDRYINFGKQGGPKTTSWGIRFHMVEPFLNDLNEERIQLGMPYIQDIVAAWKQKRPYHFENSEINQKNIRKTSNDKYSVYDIMKSLTRHKSYRNDWIVIQKEFPEDIEKWELSRYQFPGQGQKETPVINEYGMFALINVLKTPRLRNSCQLVNMENELENIRETPMGKYSVYDIIRCFTGHKNTRQDWYRLQDKHPEDIKKWDVSHYQFPGQGQKEIPVINEQGMFALIKFLKASRFRKPMCKSGTL